MKFLQGRLFFLVILVSTSYSSNAQPYMRSVTSKIELVKSVSTSSDNHSYCLSWRLAVETDNLKNWYLPEKCAKYVGNYITGGQYAKDCEFVTTAAYDHFKTLDLKKDGMDIWVFDIYETSLSNEPYYVRPDVAFGAYPYNATKFYEWVAEGKAPAIPSVLNLYKKLRSAGVKIVFISGSTSTYKKVIVSNMKNVGFDTWDMMLFKSANETKITALEFKSKVRTELVKMGYRIIGNIGDQWSDISGPHPGDRTFKIPDPLYYVA